MKILDRLSSLSTLQVRTTAILMVVVVGFTDYLVSTPVSFSVFYLVPIVFASWYDRRAFGLVLSVVSALLWYLADTISAEHASILYPIWNAVTRLIIFGGVGWALSSLRQTKIVRLQNELDRYARMMETAIEGALGLDTEGYIQYANPRASVLLGYEEQKLVGRKYTELVRDEESRTLIEEVCRRTDGQVEIEFTKHDGGTVWTLTNAGATFNSMKERDGTILLITDISYRKRAEEDLRRHYDEIVALQRLSSVLARSLHVDERLKVALETVLDVMKCDGGVIYLTDQQGKELILAQWMGLDERTVGLARRWDVRRGITGQAFRTREPQFVDDALRSATVDRDITNAEGIRGLAAIPLVAKGIVLGVLDVFSREPYPFSTSGKSMLEMLGSQIGVALENAQLYEAARTRELQVRQLSMNLVMIQEEERKKFARDLHEGLAQVLTMLRVNAQLALESLGKPDTGTEKRILEVIALVTEAEHEAKQISQDLRPSILDDFGLKPAIEVLAHNFERRTGVSVDLHLPLSDVRFASLLETTVYRIVQELLANVAKHAKATRVTIQLLVRSGVLALTVADNGKGFNIDDMFAYSNDGSHNGLRNMRERAVSVKGMFHAESSPGKGTEFSIEIPCMIAEPEPEPQGQLV